jgi:hypothetical protein
MRMLLAFTLVVAACGGPQHKKDSSIVEEGSAAPATCCCKTLPETAEKDIVPAYAMSGRMECSTQHGQCVDDVQCNASKPTDTGVPPPP